MNKSIVLLLDYRGCFYTSITRWPNGLDVQKIRSYFAEQGYDLNVKKFRDIDFRQENYAGQYILYQSSEDFCLQYKQTYIEDILLGLLTQGAILIPPFNYFRAHGNKVFMEILRDLNQNPRIKNIKSKAYGTFEEFLGDAHLFPPEVVFKASAGSGSSGVRRSRNEHEKKECAELFSRSPVSLIDKLKDIVRPYVRKNHPVFSRHREKFIVQNYVPNLGHDYKIIVFDRKYYVLLRHNRKNDFRASGSGLFEWVTTLPTHLLDFAESVFNGFEVPYISLDVGFDGNDFYLLEFQFVAFGPLTLEYSSCYFTKQDGKWVSVEEEPVLERELVNSVVVYLERLDT